MPCCVMPHVLWDSPTSAGGNTSHSQTSVSPQKCLIYCFLLVLSPASGGFFSCLGRSVLAKDSRALSVSLSLCCILLSILCFTNFNFLRPLHLRSLYPRLSETAGLFGLLSLPCSLNTASRKGDGAIIMGSPCLLPFYEDS